MTAIVNPSVIGINGSNITVGAGLSLDASAGKLVTPTTRDATDTVDTGDALAIADAPAQVGILNSTITAGINSGINVTEYSKNLATAKTATGNASASATNSGPTGGIVDLKHVVGDIKIGQDSTIAVNIDNLVKAQADATSGNADATADVGQKIGLYNIDIASGLGKSLTVAVNATTDAKATTTGVPTGDATASSGASGSNVVGIYNTGYGPVGPDSEIGDPLKIAFGTAANISSIAGIKQTAPVSITSNAQTVTGDALAQSLSNTVAGIFSDSLSAPSAGGSDSIRLAPNKLDISTGNDGRLDAAAYLKTDATSKAVTGRSNALISINTVAGIADDNVLRGEYNPDPASTAGSTVVIGNNGIVQAEAIANNTATATSVTAPAEGNAVSAEINNEYVVGISVDKLTVGENGTINAAASSTQTASASTVSSGVDPYATVAGGDHVLGISNTDIFAGNNLINPSATAFLNGSATANSVGANAGTTAEAGLGSTVVGFNHGSLKAGEYVVTSAGGLGTFTATGLAGLAAEAVATTGPVTATAGDCCATVIGLESAPVTFGKGGNLLARGDGILSATANTTTGDAEATAQQKGRGINTSNIFIGEIGTINAISTLKGSSISEATTGDSSSGLCLDAAGIKQASEKIYVGKEGDVVGIAAVTSDIELGGSTAKTTTGIATAEAGISSKGIDLGASIGETPNPASIFIGGKGSINGTGLIGVLDNEGSVTAPLKVVASNTNGAANASGGFDAAGIIGNSPYNMPTEGALTPTTEGATTIKAGPNAGNITGYAESKGSVQATTETGPAFAETGATLVGIGHANLFAGQVGSNLVAGTALGTFDTKSSATTGDASSISAVDVYGLLGDLYNNTINLSGDLTAIATLSNTVTATTTTGNALASASGNVVGLSGYDVTIHGSGVINASAISNTVATASTVTTV